MVTYNFKKTLKRFIAYTGRNFSNSQNKYDRCTERRYPARNLEVAVEKTVRTKEIPLQSYNDFGDGTTLTFNTIEKTDTKKPLKPKYANLMCQNPNHYLAHCTEYRTKQGDARLRFLKNAERCIRCLNRGNLTMECPEPKVCTT